MCHTARRAFTLIELSKTVRKGFTLIELLVVITIIVVLLALLTPALDRAVYQTMQTKCGAQLKAFGTGLTTGAMDHKRAYPKRLSTFQPINLNDLFSNDERPELKAYLGISLNKMLNCPLTIPVDIDNSPSNVYAQTSYAMWHGWRTGISETAMRRLGDSWTYKEEQFVVLANDYELGGADNYYTGQPDRDDVLTSYVEHGSFNQTASTWYAPLRTRRGLIDMNTVYTDLSVSRLRDVKHHEDDDERITFVPNTWEAGAHLNNWQRVPAH